MLVVGLTGGIASGKSVVAAIFKSLGAEHIDADEISRELVEPGTTAWGAIVDRFGQGILTRDSRIDRKRLADIIFQDSDDRRWLNALLHPKIVDQIGERVARIRQSKPNAIDIVEAALLIEANVHKDFDVVVVTSVSAETQLRRLTARDRSGKEEAESRIRAQLPVKEKLRVADFVIDNEGSLDETKRQVVELYRTLTSLSQGKKELDNWG